MPWMSPNEQQWAKRTSRAARMGPRRPLPRARQPRADPRSRRPRDNCGRVQGALSGPARRFVGGRARRGGDRVRAAAGVAGRIMSYAELMRAGNVADPEIARFFQTMHERITDISGELLFFTLEINRLEDGDLDAKSSDPALARYRPWLRDVRAQRPHQLSHDLEKLLLEKSVSGRAAWTRLFDETIAELRFPFRG